MVVSEQETVRGFGDDDAILRAEELRPLFRWARTIGETLELTLPHSDPVPLSQAKKANVVMI